MKLLDIGEVSQRSGVPPSTLRYYDEIGLIRSVARHGLRRQFEPLALTQLSLVALGKSAGFLLQDIAGMFGADGQPDLPRGDLLVRADEIDRQIGNLATLRDALRHVAECPAPSHMECPSFQKLLRLAKRRRDPSQQSKERASSE